MAKARHFDTRGHDEDPLTKAMAPPPDETDAERDIRLAAEMEAQRRSDAIDEELNRQRLSEKKTNCIKVLLLGQSESGKSTTLKNFQLFHSNKAFRTERASWRAVVQLNVVRSVRLILDAMTEAQAAASRSPSASEADLLTPKYPPLSPEHLKLKMRLLPIQQVEENLLRKMRPASHAELEQAHLSSVTNLPQASRRGVANNELALNSLTPWKSAFNKLLASSNRGSLDSEEIDFDDPNDPGVILSACKDDIIALWTDAAIQEMLSAKKMRLQDMGGFFLNQLDRVASARYIPTDDDILRARLKTIGVTEHRFTLKSGNDRRLF
ncbi:hypothetical protein H0H92_002322 [Tricholoma furcatifolium]|nr:hypothetical protein H0H92_002322 [Tricholoma furcatifolium]